MLNKSQRKTNKKSGIIVEKKIWCLLKAEIAYNTQAFIFILLTSLLGFLGIHFWKVVSRQTLANMNTGYVYLSLTYSYFVMAVLVTSWAKEKRPRQLVCLPVSIREIGAAHGFLHLIYWIFIVTLFFVWAWISKYFMLNNSVFLALGVLTGVSWFVFSIIAFTSRFRDSVAVGVIQLILILFFGAIIAAGIVHNYQRQGDNHWVDDFLSWIFQSPASALIWIMLGVGSTVIVLCLPRIKSYVQ
ncbi:MAG: hypothetical protein JSV17_17565 [Candidatus Aminicenantes bacterium]|nr:MAG: hypothetical protein JSV17_17565 [Candidatus Aminicenantes bacterium]